MNKALSLCVVLELFAVAVASAEGLGRLARGMAHKEVKTWHEQFLAGRPTKAERLEALREIVRISPYGERGLERLFRNFDGKYTIDPRIPGVEDSVLKLTSASRPQAKGYAREVLYAIDIHNDPRFTLVEMNRNIRRPWGKTDADIIFRDVQRGLYVRVEVKDMSLASQVSDMKRIKGQIDKMALESRRTGQPQVWVNRREIHPEIRRYAHRKGISVFENVSTGKGGENRTMTSKDFRDEIDRQAKGIQRARAIQGGIQVGYGLWILLDAAPAAWVDLQTVLDSTTRTGEALRRLGEHGSLTIAGGAMVVSGTAHLASQCVEIMTLQENLYRIGRVGDVVSLVALVSGEGFMIYRYRSGDISSREFWTSQWVLGGSAMGGFIGSWTGGFLGGLAGGVLTEGTGTLVGTSVGSGVGGVAGSWIGRKVTSSFVDAYYDWRFAEMDRQFADFVYDRYGVPKDDRPNSMSPYSIAVD
jgi:hypothetical protein